MHWHYRDAYHPRNHHTHPSPSPINNLPIELLSYIFSLSTYPILTTGSRGFPPGPTRTKEEEEEEKEEDGYRPPTITTESVQVPLVLSSVNRLWRQVALGTPHLWSSLCITVELIQDFYYERRDSTNLNPRKRTSSSSSSQLNTSHITSYLALSRKYPLNILIDARDENWNFEPECVTVILLTFLIIIPSVMLIIVLFSESFLIMARNYTLLPSLLRT